MAVTDFFENIIEDEDHTARQGGNGGSEREYRRYFQARVDNDTDKAWLIRVYAETPKLYDFDPDNGGYVIGVNVTKNPRAKHRIFDIEVTYTPDIEFEEFEENPLNRPARMMVTGIERSEIYYKTVDDPPEPIETTAGEYIESEHDIPGLVFKIEKNVPNEPASWFLKLANYVNEFDITLEGLDFPTGTLLLRKPTIGFVEKENNVFFRKAELEMHYKEDGWQFKTWNQGTIEKKQVFITPLAFGAVPVPITIIVPITDDKGNDVTSPVFLDEDGAAIREDGPDGKPRLKHPLDPSERVELEFKIRRELDFNVILNIFFNP